MKEPVIPVAVLSLDREDRSPGILLSLFARAVAKGSKLVVVPFGFPRTARRRVFAHLARKHRVHLVAGFVDHRRRLAVLFAPDGRVLGEYSQTHRLTDEDFEIGNRLIPIQSRLGIIGLSIGSDIYFPEVHWQLAQAGADILVHLDVERTSTDHFYSVLSPRVRAFDTHVPMLIARPSSRLVKIVNNEEMQIGGTPMSGSVVIDQNGAVLASTGFSQGLAAAELRLFQHCVCPEKPANMPLSRGLDVWKLRFADSREKFFTPLRQRFAPARKPKYRRRRIRIAVLSHTYGSQIGKNNREILRLMAEACRHKPDIIVTTEMESNCRPDSPRIKSTLNRMIALAREAGSYLLVGGIRPNKPGTAQHRSSHGWFWDRKGKLVFESAIMLYGKGCGQDTFDTDFGRIGIRLCGDVYAPELDRLFALKDVDIVFNPSMSWGASGLINTELNQARAMDNAQFVVSAHLAFSDPAQRSHVIDPNGVVVAASRYHANSVLVADVDLDCRRGVLVKAGRRSPAKNAYLAAYRTRTRHRLLSRGEQMRLRRPELYTLLDFDGELRR